MSDIKINKKLITKLIIDYIGIVTSKQDNHDKFTDKALLKKLHLIGEPVRVGNSFRCIYKGKKIIFFIQRIRNGSFTISCECPTYDFSIMHKFIDTGELDYGSAYTAIHHSEFTRQWKTSHDLPELTQKLKTNNKIKAYLKHCAYVGKKTAVEAAEEAAECEDVEFEKLEIPEDDEAARQYLVDKGIIEGDFIE